ncbi:MAG: hypothetical protein JWR77_1179, partial [Rhizorhabdus sp.]|nr:hypothetical protein [Rhizorhabdus sp.]
APLSYAEALQRVDTIIAGDVSIARGRSGEWLVQERLANAYISRARLTGSFDDYATAQMALDSGFASAPKGAGPHLTQAVLDFSLHRLARAETMLDAIDHYAIPAERETLDETGAMRGDIAFYRGDYAGALAQYRKVGESETEASYRIALYLAKTGQTDKALAAIDKMEAGVRFPTAQMLANLALLRGALELQRGEREKATRHFERADAVFPGYWLAEAHLAQMRALAGDSAGAIARFEAIATRNDSPEVMDALAALYRAGGDRVRSQLWADRAGRGWNKRLGLFPEAAYGHAVEHCLAFGDPQQALDLALRDYQARPYGASAIALGWAYLANNRPADALRVIGPVLGSAWVSADQHIVAAQAHLLLGQSDEADAEQQKALAINSHATDRDAALIWFGH